MIDSLHPSSDPSQPASNKSKILLFVELNKPNANILVISEFALVNPCWVKLEQKWDFLVHEEETRWP